MKLLNHRFFMLSGLTLAVSACTTLPHAPEVVLAEPNLPLEVSYDTPVDNISTVSIPTMPSLAATRWQDFYADEKLKALIELGLANNKNLEQATLAIQKAAAQYQITSIQNVPKLGSSGGYTRSGNTNTSAGSYNVGLALSGYELDLWGRVSNLKEQALQGYLATSAAKDSLQISLISNIAQSYANISYAKAQMILAQSTVKSRERSLYIAQRRFAAGIDSKSPSLQAESSLEGAKIAVMEAETNLLKAQNALELLIGAPIPAELSPEPAITSIVTPTVLNAGLPSELLYYRPDIAQAEYALKAAGANINVARAAFFPTISLSGNLGVSSPSLNDLFNSNGLGWNFGPSISLPIFDAGARRANYEVAEIEQKQALSAYEAAIQTAFKEVRDVLAGRMHLEEQVAAQYRLQKNYQQTYNIAYATFRSGLSNYLDVLDAERSLFAAQQNILQLELQKVISQIQLYQALGGGAVLDAAQITSEAEQSAAMTAARLATAEEMDALSETPNPESTPVVMPVVPEAPVATPVLETAEPETISVTPADGTDSTPTVNP